MNGIVGFSIMGPLPVLRKQLKLSCRTCSVIAMLGVAFGGHDLQILRHLSLFSVGDFLMKEPTAITQEAWRTLNVTLNGLLPAPIINKLLEELTKHLK
jgi:hypothetical protein